MLSIAPVPDDTCVALFLDLDGTLVDIRARPELATAEAALLSGLEALHERLGGALAVVSGRTVAGIDQVLRPLRLPAAGVHGLELRSRPREPVERVSVEALPPETVDRLLELARSHPGMLLEQKGLSVALHYRGAPDEEAVADAAIAAELERLGPDFVVQHGKMVLELRPAGATKGTAVERFMQASPYRGRMPIYIGDDVTDEDAFRSVKDLDGLAIRVGGADADTLADWRLPDVASVRSWLETLARRHPRNCA